MASTSPAFERADRRTLSDRSDIDGRSRRWIWPWRAPTPRRPVLIVLGKRGVGKSSTLNHLFGLELASDAAQECTVRPSLHADVGPVVGRRGPTMDVVDLPGIAAGMESRRRFRRHYRRWIARADVVLWLTQADVRAYKQDQVFFRAYSPLFRRGSRLVIGVTKFDLLLSLSDATRQGAVEELVDRKIADLRSVLDPYLPPVADVSYVAFSTAANWNIGGLLSALQRDEGEI